MLKIQASITSKTISPLYTGKSCYLMVCGVFWVDIVAPRGVKAAIGFEELAIVTIEGIHKKSTSRKQPSKANLNELIVPYQK